MHMAEIDPPGPIKPIWPTRRDENPARRLERDEDKEKPARQGRDRPRKKPDEPDDGKPHIDDYA